MRISGFLLTNCSMWKDVPTRSKVTASKPGAVRKMLHFPFLPGRRKVPGEETLDSPRRKRGIVRKFPWAGYFSRRITSPWPTSWSLSHRRYL